MNQVILTGYLTRDIELAYTESGKAVTKVGLAVRKRYSDESDFYTIKIWDKLAEHAAKYLRKGSKILVRGHLVREIFLKDDMQIERIVIECEEIEFLARAKSEDIKAEDTAEQSESTPSVQQKFTEDYPDYTGDEGEGEFI